MGLGIFAACLNSSSGYRKRHQDPISGITHSLRVAFHVLFKTHNDHRSVRKQTSDFYGMLQLMKYNDHSWASCICCSKKHQGGHLPWLIHLVHVKLPKVYFIQPNFQRWKQSLIQVGDTPMTPTRRWQSHLEPRGWPGAHVLEKQVQNVLFGVMSEKWADR